MAQNSTSNEVSDEVGRSGVRDGKSHLYSWTPFNAGTSGLTSGQKFAIRKIRHGEWDKVPLEEFTSDGLARLRVLQTNARFMNLEKAAEIIAMSHLYFKENV